MNRTTGLDPIKPSLEDLWFGVLLRRVRRRIEAEREDAVGFTAANANASRQPGHILPMSVQPILRAIETADGSKRSF